MSAHPARGLVEQYCLDKSAVDDCRAQSRSIDGRNSDQAENEHAETHNCKERSPTQPNAHRSVPWLEAPHSLDTKLCCLRLPSVNFLYFEPCQGPRPRRACSRAARAELTRDFCDRSTLRSQSRRRLPLGSQVSAAKKVCGVAVTKAVIPFGSLQQACVLKRMRRE